MGWGPRICSSNLFPGGADIAGLGTTLENHQFKEFGGVGLGRAVWSITLAIHTVAL